MLLRRMGETVTLEQADGTTTDVPHAIFYDASATDQEVTAGYKGDQKTLTIIWPKDAPHNLMDAFVWVRGERYRIYANPTPPSSAPNGYDLIVTATASMYLYDIELGTPTRTRDAWGVWHTTFKWTSAKANLLRHTDGLLHEARQDGMESSTMFELQQDAWSDEYTHLRFQEKAYTIESIERASGSVVIGCVRDVTDD